MNYISVSRMIWDMTVEKSVNLNDYTTYTVVVRIKNNNEAL